MKEEFKDLKRLYEFCSAKYPEEVWENVDILFNEIWPRIGANKQTANNGTRSRESGDNLLMHDSHKREDVPNVNYDSYPYSKYTVLFTIEPCRKDYQSFFSPIMEKLHEYGVSMAILISKSDPGKNISPELFPYARFIFVEDFRTRIVDKLSVIYFSKLSPIIEQLCSDLEMSQMERNGTIIFFKYFCLQKELFKHVIETISPSIIFGLHYIGRPGYIKAINDLKEQNSNLKSVLIQHGIIGNSICHDFKGADYVIMWNEYYESLLRSPNKIIHVPVTKVIGNPKLENAIKKSQKLNNAFPGCENIEQQKIILFLSNDVKGTVIKTREMFAQVTNKMEDIIVIYKLHPGETLEYYYPLIDKGLLKKKQIIKDVSIYNMINVADIVVGIASSSLYDAIALGKPAIQFSMPGSVELFKGVIQVSTKEELYEKIRMLIGDSTYKESVVRKGQEFTKLMIGNTIDVSNQIAIFLKELM